jgi:predicted RNA-binding Zn-ribbon protein involved in translation (DUF1610 family)
MKKTNIKKCPVCGTKFEGLGALSRRDNKTEICSDCGTAEALVDYFSWKLKDDK